VSDHAGPEPERSGEANQSPSGPGHVVGRQRDRCRELARTCTESYTIRLASSEAKKLDLLWWPVRCADGSRQCSRDSRESSKAGPGVRRARGRHRGRRREPQVGVSSAGSMGTGGGALRGLDQGRREGLDGDREGGRSGTDGRHGSRTRRRVSGPLVGRVGAGCSGSDGGRGVLELSSLSPYNSPPTIRSVHPQSAAPIRSAASSRISSTRCA